MRAKRKARNIIGYSTLVLHEKAKET